MKRLVVLAIATGVLTLAPPGALTAVGDRYGGPLTARQVVPSADSRGTGTLVMRQIRRQTLRYSLETRGLSGRGRRAEIRIGKRGENGLPIFVLRDRSFGRRISGTLIPRDMQRRGDVDTFNDAIRLFNRGRAYVVVTTEDFPNGEIRGQIRRLRR